MAYPDAADTIPDLFTWASAAHNEMFTHPGARTVGQFPGSRPSADETGDASGFSGRAQHAKAGAISKLLFFPSYFLLVLFVFFKRVVLDIQDVDSTPTRKTQH